MLETRPLRTLVRQLATIDVTTLKPEELVTRASALGWVRRADGESFAIDAGHDVFSGMDRKRGTLGAVWCVLDCWHEYDPNEHDDASAYAEELAEFESRFDAARAAVVAELGEPSTSVTHAVAYDADAGYDGADETSAPFTAHFRAAIWPTKGGYLILQQSDHDPGNNGWEIDLVLYKWADPATLPPLPCF